MTRHHLTIWFSTLALAVAMLFVAHDVVMATDPHSRGRHGDHGPVAALHPAPDTLHHTQNSTPSPYEIACGAVEASPPVQLTHQDGLAGAIIRPFMPLYAGHCVSTWLALDASGAPPNELRAMFQVWLI